MDDIIVKSGDQAGKTDVDTSALAIAPAGGVVDKPSFDDTTEIELEGGDKITLKELKSGHLRQSDYTRKTQELATTKKEYEQYAQMAAWLNDPANSERAQKILDILDGKEPATTETDEFADPRDKDIADLRKELKTLQQGLGQRDITSAKREVEAEVAAVKDKYKDIDDEEMKDILSIAQANKGENLIKVADRYFGRLEKRDKTKLKTYLEDKEKDNKKVPLVGGGIPPTGEKKKLSLEDGSAKQSLIARLVAGAKAANE